MTLIYILLGALAIVAVFLIGIYNSLVAKKQKCNQAFADIDVQLKQRQNLIPNLVETVKGYAGHEREALERVVQARNQVVRADGPAAAGQADEALEGALRQLFAVAEAYPDLQASSSFLQLQRELADLEEDIAFARRYHNAVVEDLNTAIQTFPSMLVARPFGFREREDVQAGAGDRRVPDVGFTS